MTEGKTPARARNAWESTRSRPYGEDRDPAYRLALRGIEDPLDAEFVECATTVFAPLLAVLDDVRVKVAE